MKTIIAGSRSIDYLENIDSIIKSSGFNITEVVCGIAKGVDLLGKKWAEDSGIPVIPFPAHWSDLSYPDAIIKTNAYGKYDAKAGFRRNQEMANYGEVLLLIWDGCSSGSQDMLDKAKEAGLEIFVYNMLEESMLGDFI